MKHIMFSRTQKLFIEPTSFYIYKQGCETLSSIRFQRKQIHVQQYRQGTIEGLIRHTHPRDGCAASAFSGPTGSQACDWPALQRPTNRLRFKPHSMAGDCDPTAHARTTYKPGVGPTGCDCSRHLFPLLTHDDDARNRQPDLSFDRRARVS